MGNDILWNSCDCSILFSGWSHWWWSPTYRYLTSKIPHTHLLIHTPRINCPIIKLKLMQVTILSYNFHWCMLKIKIFLLISVSYSEKWCKTLLENGKLFSRCNFRVLVKIMPCKKLVIDTDGVSDDVRAVSLALQSPNVKVPKQFTCSIIY